MPMPVRSLNVLQNWDCHGCTDCCRDYRVQLSDEERKRIGQLDWSGEPALQGADLFVRDGGWFSKTYRLNQSNEKGCVFLDEKGGCRIHARFGAAAKPLACRVFPFAFVPLGGHWRVGLRFACPSAARNLGRPLSEHAPEMRRHVEELESKQGFAGRALPAPSLQKGQSIPWSDIELFIGAFVAIIEDERRPLEWRLRKCLAVIELCRSARFDTVTGKRLKEFLAVVSEGVDPDVPARSEAVAPPSWIGRMLFRQMLAIYIRKDAGLRRGVSRHGRRALLVAAWRFAAGTGRVPALHADIPEATFEAAEQPRGTIPADVATMLARYYAVKIESGQFFGPSNFQRPFWDGLEALIATFPAICWLARVLHDKPVEESFVLALRVVDDSFGFNPLLGSRRQLFASRLVARRGDLARLVAWYNR